MADAGPEPTTPIGRRALLAGAVVSAGGVLFGARAQEVLQRVLLPVTLHDPTGLSDLLPVAGRFRIYSVTRDLPQRADDDYRLRVGGLVATPLELTMGDLRAGLPQARLVRDFQCVTGWRVLDVPWAGVRLVDVLAAAGPAAAATHVVMRSFDGAYSESLTIDQARRDDVLVAHSLEGRPLSREHGGPARLYVAPMYGYKSLKWLESIEVVDRLVGDGGYWEERGYDRDAWVGASNGGHEERTS